MKVRIQSGECPSYLTVGKVYEVSYFYEDDKSKPSIIADNHHIVLSMDNCAHLNGGSWEIVDE